MDLDEIELEIFSKYRLALQLVGVDFSDYRIIVAIEDCAQNLESRLQAFLAWHEYLYRQGDRLFDPTEVLVQVFVQEWQPIGWQDRYLKEIECRWQS